MVTTPDVTLWMLTGLDIETAIGLEIGALDSPMIPQSRGNVHYVDRATTDQIHEWYANASAVDTEKIVDIDFVWGDNTLAEATGKAEFYDYCIASHVIEHVPDLIGWMNEIAAILRDGGTAAFLIPDRRFTFDYLRPESSIAAVVAAHLENRRKPTIASTFEHFSLHTDLDPNHAWLPNFDASALTPNKSLAEVLKICNQAVETGDYIDTHCWVFTQDSFIKLVAQLAELDLIDFQLDRILPVAVGSFEFAVKFKKIANHVPLADRKDLIISSLKRCDPHRLHVEYESHLDGELNVYYDLGAGFGFNHSVSTQLPKTNGPSRIEVELPSQKIHAIHLDPRMNATDCKIHQIWFSPFSDDQTLLPVDHAPARILPANKTSLIRKMGRQIARRDHQNYEAPFSPELQERT